MLSAVPKDSWSGSQKLSFSTIKGHKAQYLDVRSLFPTGRSDSVATEPELLPEEAAAIVELAVKKSKE